MPDLTRRRLLQATAAATAAGLAAPALDADLALAAGGPFVPYGRRSYFRRPILGHPVNRRRTRAFREFMRNHPEQEYDYPRINGVDGSEWGTPFAMGTGGDPVWRLTDVDNRRAARLAERGFHAPAWLADMLTGTSDSPLCVVDRRWGFTMFCGNAVRVGHRLIRARHASITYHDSNGLDHRHPRSDDHRNFTSRGRISDAMVIRRDLVRHGVRHRTDLGHVLQLFLVETRTADGFRGPMVGCEKGKHGFGAEGERIAIAPDVDLSQRRMSPEARVIARTLQRYGAYFGDNSGSSSSLHAEQENARRPLWHGRLRQDALRALSWDDFVVLD